MNDKTFIDKVQFYSVAFGSDADSKTLQSIASAFGSKSKFLLALDATTLKQTFEDLDRCKRF